jgi:hypothetical protein
MPMRVMTVDAPDGEHPSVHSVCISCKPSVSWLILMSLINCICSSCGKNSNKVPKAVDELERQL